MPEKGKKFIDILIEKDLLSKEQADESAREQKNSRISLQDVLIKKGSVSEENIAKAIAEQLDIPYVKLSEEKIDPQAAKMISEDMARHYKAIPVRIKGEALYVAFVSPLDLPARDEIRHVTGLEVRALVATEKEMTRALNQYYKVEEISKQALVDLRMQKLKTVKKADAVKIEESLGRKEDLPIVKLVSDIINGAINSKASDIHLESQDPDMIVRYRVDGILHDIMTIPVHAIPSVISRIKILSNLDITKQRVPQDGHITIKKDDKKYDLRVSTLMTIAGEKVVIRVLDRDSMMIGLGELGFTDEDEQEFRLLINKPYGMMLVTGPTGSGKTTTLYAVLNQINSDTNNIVTIENPVEYRLNRINQIQVDPASKITFATGLRTILRQDPDTIMVGEIRDTETGEIAVQAALTGHLVLSTLHTNDAPSALTRLIDMGIEPFLISSTVIGTIAQRLCRRICPECKEEYTPDKKELDSIGLSLEPGRTLARGKGCNFCFNTGYKGRLAAFEIMKMSPGIRRLVNDNEPVEKIRELAVNEGMRTLQENAKIKVKDKITTIDEVKRVIYLD
ncbi:MAG: ATPase, T2SS/T4P/T4SS family [Candidatus Omnitrophota bacterium]